MKAPRGPDALRSAIASPCIGICQLDQDRVCTGCGRSIEEIARWSQMSDPERERVMNRLRVVAKA